MSHPPTLLQRRLQAASGYFELGILDEAARELNEVPPEEKNRIEVLALHLVVSSAQKDWDEAAAWGEAAVQAGPDEASLWIQYAYAVRRARSIEAAEAVLLQAKEKHPEEATIHYNLACYACVSGKIPEAKSHLREAFARESDYKALARNDEDLRALRDVVDDLDGSE